MFDLGEIVESIDIKFLCHVFYLLNAYISFCIVLCEMVVKVSESEVTEAQPMAILSVHTEFLTLV